VTSEGNAGHWLVVMTTLRMGRDNLFLLWALTALALQMAIRGVPYDSGGVGGLAVITSPVWGFMFWIPSELAFTLNDGRELSGHTLLSVLLGLALSLSLDWGLRWLRR